jgi:hypothetical protein
MFVRYIVALLTLMYWYVLLMGVCLWYYSDIFVTRSALQVVSRMYDTAPDFNRRLVVGARAGIPSTTKVRLHVYRSTLRTKVTVRTERIQ